MYCLYLDDSGSIKNKNEQYFVLGGVIVPEGKHYWINKHLDDLASLIAPSDPYSVEFHACEIFSGRKDCWKSITDKSKRIDIIKKVLEVPCREQLKTIACAIDKSGYSSETILTRVFEDVIARFQLYLSLKHRETNTNTNGLVIFDEAAFESDIQTLARTFRSTGTRYRAIPGIQEVPFFVDSKASRAIQLADHIAYSVFRRYNANDLTYFNVIENQFGMLPCPTQEYGLFHMTQNHNICTCPACVNAHASN